MWMKFLLLSFFPSFIITGAGAQSWRTVGTAGFSTGATEFNAVAVNPSGTPYMAYSDYGNGGKETVMKFNGTKWVAVGTGVISSGSTEYSSITFDHNGNLYVAFQDGANGNAATVEEFTSNAWHTVGTAGFTVTEADYCFITIDQSNNPCLAYEDAGNKFKGVVKKFKTSGWTTVGTNSISVSSADHITLVFDAGNNPYIGFEDGNQNNKATVEKLVGTMWTAIGGHAGITPGSAQFPQLAMDPSGNLYLSFTDWNNNGSASVMEYNAGTDSWSAFGNPDFPAGLAYYTTIAFDASGTPYVAYSDWGGSFQGNATLMKYSGGSWNLVGLQGFTPSEADYISLTIDNSGNPYLGYSDLNANDKASVSKFSCLSASTPVIAAQDTGVCGSGTIILSVASGTLNDAANWTWYAGSLGGSSIGTGSVISINISSTTTFYVRGEGGCPAPGTAASATILVHPGNTYYADVDGDGFGDANSTIVACTLPKGYVTNNTDCDDNNANIYPGNAPYNLALASSTPISATITWSATCSAAYYQVNYRLGSTNTWTVWPTYLNASTLTVTLDTLLEGRSYKVRVAAFNSSFAIISPWSATFALNTPSYDFSFLNTGLSVTNITNNGAQLNWNGGPYNSTFQVEFRQSGTTTWTSKSAGQTNFYKAKNLISSTTYNWQVRATNGIYNSAWVAGPDFTTLLAPGSPFGGGGTDAAIVSITPNPVHSEFMVNAHVNSTRVIVKVVNILGKTMWQQTLPAYGGQIYQLINSAQWAPGIYIVAINDDDKIITGRVAIEK
jgi:hypothetical protein